MKKPFPSVRLSLAIGFLVGQGLASGAESSVSFDLSRSADVRTQLVDDANGRFDKEGDFKGSVLVSEGISVTKVNIWGDLAPHAVYFSGLGDLMIQRPVESSETVDESPSEKSVVFIQFRTKPALDLENNAATVFDVAGAKVAFRLVPDLDSTGELLIQKAQDLEAVEPEPTESRIEWLKTGVFFAVNRSGQAEVSQTFTFRLDSLEGSFDLWYFGRLFLSDRSYLPRESDILVRSVSEHQGQITEVRATETNPLFLDKDSDGIPDQFEEMVGSSSDFDDRALVLSEFGRTSLEIYRLSLQRKPFEPTP